MQEALIAWEMLPMNASDLEDVAAAEAEVTAFAWSAGHYRDSLASGHMAWVCRVGGELMGHLVMMQVLDEAHLLNVVVRRKFQGHGLGARLLRFALAEAEQRGASSMFLEVRPSNIRALKLYQHFGFAQVGLRRAYYPAQTGREDALVMERKIP